MTFYLNIFIYKKPKFNYWPNFSLIYLIFCHILVFAFLEWCWSIVHNMNLFTFHLLEHVLCWSNRFDQANFLIVEIEYAIIILQELSSQNPVFLSFLHVHASHCLGNEKQSGVSGVVWVDFHVTMLWKLKFFGFAIFATDHVEFDRW